MVQLQLAGVRAGGGGGASSPTPDAEQLRTSPPPPSARRDPLAPRSPAARAHEPGTPTPGPGTPCPSHGPPLTVPSRSPGALGPRRRVPSPPGVPRQPQPEPPARPSSRPRKTHQSATRSHVRGSGGRAGRSGLQQHSRRTPVTWVIVTDIPGPRPKSTEEHGARRPRPSPQTLIVAASSFLYLRG